MLTSFSAIMKEYWIWTQIN